MFKTHKTKCFLICRDANIHSLYLQFFSSFAFAIFDALELRLTCGRNWNLYFIMYSIWHNNPLIVINVKKLIIFLTWHPYWKSFHFWLVGSDSVTLDTKLKLKTMKPVVREMQTQRKERKLWFLFIFKKWKQRVYVSFFLTSGVGINVMEK